MSALPGQLTYARELAREEAAECEQDGHVSGSDGRWWPHVPRGADPFRDLLAAVERARADRTAGMHD